MGLSAEPLSCEHKRPLVDFINTIVTQMVIEVVMLSGTFLGVTVTSKQDHLMAPFAP